MENIEDRLKKAGVVKYRSVSTAVRLPEILVKKLDGFCKREKVNRTAVIIIALDEFLSLKS